jgi:hypothetical protein
MRSQIDLDAKAIGAGFEPTRPIFDLSRDGKDVLDALILRTPSVQDAFESLKERICLPKSAEAKIEGRFYRLPNHNRSFCYGLSRSGSMAESPVIVFKGSEPLLGDFQRMIEWMSQAPLRKSSRVMVDHFPLAEGKIPGVLSRKEAIREAEVALDVQRKHLKHYGELARVPSPLLIHSVSEQRREACAAVLRGKLSKSAFDRIEPLLQDGIAVYAYYYPAPPIRANFLGDMGAPEFRTLLERIPSKNDTVTGWARLIARLFYLGYLPCSVRSEGLGACMDLGNAALDGGFCDPDSIVTIEPSMDDEFFRESVVRSLLTFQDTVQMTFGMSSSTLYPNIEKFVFRQYILYLMNDAFASEKRPALVLDGRLSKILSPRSFEDVALCIGRKKRFQAYAQYAKHNT